MTRNLTKFKVYRNTPFINFYTTIHFNNNSERDDYFNKWTDTDTFDNRMFNMIRDRLSVQAPKNLAELNEMNYASFEYNGTLFYCYITGIEYKNDDVSQIQLVIDTLMTYTQGEFTEKIGYVMIDRQHLPNTVYKKNLYYLQSNPDLFNFSKQYRHQLMHTFNDLVTVFSSACDLEGNFGDVSSPKMPMAKGLTYDKIPSPRQVYVCLTEEDYKTFNEEMSDYAWIAQNISSISRIPKDMLDMSQITAIKSDTIGAAVYKFNNDSISADITSKIYEINMTFDTIYSHAYTGSANIPKHLFVSPNTTLEAFDWSGQKLELNPSELPTDGLKWIGKNILGHFNEIAIYPSAYSSNAENAFSSPDNTTGTFLNNALIFKSFDEIPILINNYNLSMAKSSFSRNLAKSKTLTGRAEKIVNGNLQDKLFNAISLTSNIASGGVGNIVSNVANMATSEYELSREQKVQEKEYSIESPTITEQTYNNSLQTKYDIFGITVKLSACDNLTWEYLTRYSGKFGLNWNRYDKPQSITSMPIMNFLKFSGVWQLPNVPVEHMATLSALFEAGVHFYHKTEDIFNLDLITNVNS